MNYYKNYEKQSLGGSDVALVTLVGCKPDGITAEILHFGGDGYYRAYIVDEECEIPSHYHFVTEFEYWMRAFDDEERTCKFYAKEIKVYRAGDYGCIIQLIEEREDM